MELIGELCIRSAEFRTRWAAHNVRFHRTGHKKLHHPTVGRLDLEFEAMEFPAHPGL
ncbi:MmyB family transcriptional regulator, partial [Nocardia gipuzkoensis]|uniref:MmyB family transcriptional regulator n=1 Tax=Nocardia gipuzkoensis TaxID=2749991 RepID=UPI003F69D9FB